MSYELIQSPTYRQGDHRVRLVKPHTHASISIIKRLQAQRYNKIIDFEETGNKEKNCEKTQSLNSLKFRCYASNIAIFEVECMTFFSIYLPKILPHFLPIDLLLHPL